MSRDEKTYEISNKTTIIVPWGTMYFIPIIFSAIAYYQHGKFVPILVVFIVTMIMVTLLFVIIYSKQPPNKATQYTISHDKVSINHFSKGGIYLTILYFKDIIKIEYSNDRFKKKLTIWYKLDDELMRQWFKVPILENASDDWQSILDHIVKRLPHNVEIVK